MIKDKSEQRPIGIDFYEVDDGPIHIPKSTSDALFDQRLSSTIGKQQTSPSHAKRLKKTLPFYRDPFDDIGYSTKGRDKYPEVVTGGNEDSDYVDEFGVSSPK